VPQEREIFPRLTAEENLLMGARKVPGRIFEMFPVLRSMLGRCCVRRSRGARRSSRGSGAPDRAAHVVARRRDPATAI